MIRVYRSLLDQFVRSNNLLSGNPEYLRNIKEYTKSILSVECEKFLLVGKVQSGKTLTFTGLICSLFDSSFTTGIVLSGTKLNLHQQTLKRLSQELIGLKIRVISDDDPKLFDEINDGISYGYKILIICLKHYERIAKLNESLEIYNHLQSFLIDDESDQASLNNYNYINIFNEDFQHSSTFKSILDLIRSNINKYIQITATPAAHFLTDYLDVFKPDYFGLVPPHDNYLGNDHFFENNSSGSVEIIPQSSKVDTYYLSKFILEYFTACVHLYNRDIRNVSSFIHGDSTMKINNDYYNELQSIVTKIREQPLSYLNESIHNTQYLLDNLDILLTILNLFKIQKVYGKFDSGINWQDFFEENRFFCLVGGAKLERGFTIEGLTHSFIPRTSKRKANSDTLQQRARFFGSKKHIKNFCKVFITEKSYNEFLEYAINESYLFANFKLVNNSKDSAEIFSFDLANPCRRGVISDIRSVIKNKWQHVYIFQNVKEVFDNIIQDSSLISYHPDSGDTQNRKHLVFTLNRNAFISSFRNEESFKPYDRFGDSEEYANLNFIKFKTLSKLLLDLEKITFIKLGEDLSVSREYSSKRLNNYNVLVPKSVHSGRSTDGTYIGDSNIIIADSNNGLTIHFQRVILDGIESSEMLVLSFYYNG